MRIEASFDVTGWDQSSWDESPSGTLARARVTKTFHGGAEGTSVAEVLTAETSDGPAAYTAQERFTGTLDGRAGSFIAQHGAAEAGDSSGWVIVSGSGSDDLVGLTGTAVLTVSSDGSHVITFDVELP